MKKKSSIFLLAIVLIIGLSQNHAFGNEKNIEITYWESIKDSKDPDLYQSYLDKYPDGAFADIATIFKTKYSKGSSKNEKSTKKKNSPKPRLAIKKEEKVPAVRKKVNNVAIFPFKFRGDAGFMKSVLVNDLTRIGERYRCINYSHSYYELPPTYDENDLASKERTASGMLDEYRIWKGAYPNPNSISRIANHLGVDAVITGSLNITNPWSDFYQLGDIDIFVIDARTKTMVEAKNRSKSGDARDALPHVIQSSLQDYTAEFCE